MFRLLVDKTENGRSHRRVTSIEEISGRTQSSVADVRQVVSHFCQAGAPLIVMSQFENSTQARIDLAHEAVIRQWSRLSSWVELEAESAQFYKRILVAAHEWTVGGELLSGGLLRRAVRWQQLEGPNRLWARRYSNESDFDTAMEFIRTSEQELNNPEPKEKIFLSYRRSDSAHAADRIYEHLAGAFGDDTIFYDVETIRAGEQFRTKIGAAIGRCAVVLVIIGDHWRTLESNGVRRLEDPEDFVRFEIHRAISAGIKVIPILVSESAMPQRDELPEDIRELCDFNAAEIFPGPGFMGACDQLIQQIQELMPRKPWYYPFGFARHRSRHTTSKARAFFKSL